MLRFFDAGVLENPIQESGADVSLGMDRNRDDPFRRRIPELPVAAFPCGKFLEAVVPQQANELGPRHESIFKPNVGLCQGVRANFGANARICFGRPR